MEPVQNGTPQVEPHTGAQPETFNPWSVVHLVFSHLATKGLHPVLGEAGDPGEPAAALLRALGIEPRAEGDLRVKQGIHEHLSLLRETVLGPGP